MIILLFFLLGEKNIAKVGNIYITKKDFIYQLKIDSIYQRKILSNEAILFTLIKNAVYEVIAETQGIRLNNEMFEAETIRINKETLAPLTLKAIKEVFGGDKKSYINIYVKPIIINRLIYNKFYFDTLYHEKPYKLAKKLLKEFKSNKITDTTYYKKWICKKEDPDSWFLVEVLEEYISKMKEGEVYPELIEDKLSYKIIRLISKSENFCELDGFVVPKNSFDEWFHRQQVKIKIYDKKMDEGIKNIIKNTYWEKILVWE